MELTSSLTIPTSWHAGSHALPPDLVNYFPRGIWLLISSFTDARHLIHALSDDIILALWVKQIGLRVIVCPNYVGMEVAEHLHNPFGGPAEITTCSDGRHIEIWYENGDRHRIDGPARIEICPDGSRKEAWYKNDQYHRIDGPAYSHIYLDGRRIENWFKNGVLIK